MAGVIRGLVEREIETDSQKNAASLWEIAGIGRETEPLINGVPVSESPDLYLEKATAVRAREARRSRRRG